MPTGVLQLIASYGMTIGYDYIVIEDADLRPNDLIGHFTKHWFRTLAAYNMTEALGLKGNYLYVIWTDRGAAPQLAGERIW